MRKLAEEILNEYKSDYVELTGISKYAFDILIRFANEYANQKQDECPRCQGTGEDGFDRCVPPSPYTCEDCNGTGIKQEVKQVSDEEIKKLQHHKDTTVGLYAIDQNPKDVSKEWIEKNAFRIDY